MTRVELKNGDWYIPVENNWLVCTCTANFKEELRYNYCPRCEKPLGLETPICTDNSPQQR